MLYYFSHFPLARRYAYGYAVHGEGSPRLWVRGPRGREFALVGTGKGVCVLVVRGSRGKETALAGAEFAVKEIHGVTRSFLCSHPSLFIMFAPVAVLYSLSIHYLNLKSSERNLGKGKKGKEEINFKNHLYI